MHFFSNSLNLGLKLKKVSINTYLNNKNESICRYFFKIGYIQSYNIDYKNNYITIYLNNRVSFIKNISTPGGKKYIKYKNLKKLWLHKKHTLILSTNKGILTNKEAIKYNIGGELLFLIRC